MRGPRKVWCGRHCKGADKAGRGVGSGAAPLAPAMDEGSSLDAESQSPQLGARRPCIERRSQVRARSTDRRWRCRQAHSSRSHFGRDCHTQAARMLRAPLLGPRASLGLAPHGAGGLEHCARASRAKLCAALARKSVAGRDQPAALRHDRSPPLKKRVGARWRIRLGTPRQLRKTCMLKNRELAVARRRRCHPPLGAKLAARRRRQRSTAAEMRGGPTADILGRGEGHSSAPSSSSPPAAQPGAGAVEPTPESAQVEAPPPPQPPTRHLDAPAMGSPAGGRRAGQRWLAVSRHGLCALGHARGRCETPALMLFLPHSPRLWHGFEASRPSHTESRT